MDIEWADVDEEQSEDGATQNNCPVFFGEAKVREEEGECGNQQGEHDEGDHQEIRELTGRKEPGGNGE